MGQITTPLLQGLRIFTEALTSDSRESSNFLKESGDDEYKSDQSASEDEVDSDFDIDEGAEPDSDQEESEPKRKRRVVTKAYKEPLKTAKPNPKARKAWAQPSGSEKVKEEKREPFELQGDVGENRKSVRQSTTEHTRLTYLRLQERQVQPRRRKGPHHDRPLTQEELLAEAKITAEINLRSLENYERLEADKKKQVHKKRRCDGPLVRFHSVLTPLVSETHLKEETVDVEGLDQDPQQQPTPPSTASQDPPQPPTGQCARTFITFSDEETFESFFLRPRAHRPPVREICPVTHKPALYRDPITDIPYSNIRAFKIIREAYRKYVTAHGLPNTAAGGLGSPGDPNSRGTRQKIIIKQRMSAT
ncbi:vacuolar protein sorting-associated protein 72 homolog isoform X2 [Acipenser ruthenus]|uniref:vacuolar protein sorting-associated protein 72 homolog isoform X2 n=1 Tax=Acipenser ruthenus TaxID=7906 RepID=UPI002740D988|nr:vacuolar protein sorting-associated protein 72 homolog isoform X2 [Acipenser ruthenus]